MTATIAKFALVLFGLILQPLMFGETDPCNPGGCCSFVTDGGQFCLPASGAAECSGGSYKSCDTGMCFSGGSCTQGWGQDFSDACCERGANS